MNRVLQYLSSDCKCCKARRVAERWEAVAEAIEDDLGGTDVIELIPPSASGLMEGRQPKLSFYVSHSPEPCTDLSNARDYLSNQMRTLADLLFGLAGKVEGGCQDV